MGNESYQRVYKLKQQTPIIHFQHYENGATLRASEVKPKLDKFIIKKMGGIENIDNSWFIGDKKKNDDGFHPALNYKLQIKAKGNAKVTNETKAKLGYLGTERKLSIKGSYFGNMAKGGIIQSYKESVFHSDGIEFGVVCFIPELLSKIDESLKEFFLSENFGTRQSKGFGGFIIEGTDIKALLKNTDYEPLKNAYYVKVTDSNYDSVLDDIKNISSMLRDSEKSKIKEMFRNFNFKMKNVLVFLGITNDYKFNNGKRVLRVGLPKNVERFKSFVTFKAVGNYILFIPNEISEEMYGKRFNYSGKEIQTPTKNEFNKNKFLESFAEAVNSGKIKVKTRGKRCDTKYILRKVSEIV